jgi:O-antigen/teichoic acid export membrane protein
VHSSLINASNILISSLDTILVYHYLGAAELALYAFAMAPVIQARAILNTPTVLAIPKLANRTATDLARHTGGRTAGLFLLGLLLTVGYCALAFPFYKIFFPQYLDALPFSLVFATTIMLQVGTAYILAAVDGRATLIPKHLLYLWNIPGLVIAASAFLLIQRFGLWGAITGQVLSYASSCAITWFLWTTILAPPGCNQVGDLGLELLSQPVTNRTIRARGFSMPSPIISR